MAGNLKWETELLIITAQEQAIRMNLIKGNIDNTQLVSKDRTCKKGDESINCHLLYIFIYHATFDDLL